MKLITPLHNYEKTTARFIKNPNQKITNTAIRAVICVLIFAGLFINSCYSQDTNDTIATKHNDQQKQEAILGITLPPGKSIGFNTYDSYSRVIHFKNYSEKDALIQKKIFLEKPLQLEFRNILVIPNGDPVLRVYNLLLNPGDSVILLKNADDMLTMEYSSGVTNFIDSLIVVPKDFGDEIKKQQKLLKEGEINLVLNNIEATFKKNEAAISNLNITETQSGILSDFNYNLKYSAIANILSAPALFSPKLTDSLYEATLQDIDHIQSINTLQKANIIGTIIGYKIKKGDKNKHDNDFWSNIVESDQQTKQSGFYKPYLVSCVAGTFVYAPKDIKGINQKLKTVYGRDPFLDTLYRLTGILSNTYTDFKKAKEDLKTFAGGRFFFILENNGTSSNHETKSVAGLPAVMLNDFAGKTYDFKKIIRNKNQKITIVDFWASWCIPCIMQIPNWNKMKEKFKNKPVRFVSISIDKKQDIGKWIAASKRHGMYKEPHQYILGDFKNSPLTQLIGLRTIPRYIVISNDGKILDENFYRPDEEQFELELLKHLE